ncbi:MAG: hypothetical protein JNL81_16070 [Hyphomonadaceae bacterium]|nr:hypothetical protein [Hyphomonadaceae bacterium]
MAREQHSTHLLQSYLIQFPNGEHVEEARAIMREVSEQYPPTYRMRFMNACANQGANETYCACAWYEITRTLTVAEFEDIERVGSAHPLSPRLDEAIRSCG